MNKLTRISATVAASVALVAGFTGAVSASSISGTEDDSRASIKNRAYTRHYVNNETHVNGTNNNPQDATSGNVNVVHNDEVDSATSGSAMNDSEFNAMVEVSNTTAAAPAAGGSGSGWGESTITDTEDDSHAYIDNYSSTQTTVRNETNVHLTNNNEQTAKSGSVWVSGNDEVGSVTSGNAHNSSTATFNVSVSNN